MFQEFPAVITPLLVLAYLAWFAVVLARRLLAPRLRAAPLRAAPLRAQFGALGLDTCCFPRPAWWPACRVPRWCWPRCCSRRWHSACGPSRPGPSPRSVTSKVLPCALAGIGIRGLWLARELGRGYAGIVRNYGLSGNGSGDTFAHLVVVQAYGFLIAGLWLAWRRTDPAGPVGRLVRRVPGRGPGQRARPRWGLALLAVFCLFAPLTSRSARSRPGNARCSSAGPLPRGDRAAPVRLGKGRQQAQHEHLHQTGARAVR